MWQVISWLIIELLKAIYLKRISIKRYQASFGEKLVWLDIALVLPVNIFCINNEGPGGIADLPGNPSNLFKK